MYVEHSAVCFHMMFSLPSHIFQLHLRTCIVSKDCNCATGNGRHIMMSIVGWFHLHVLKNGFLE